MPPPTGPNVAFLFTDIEGSTRLERAVGGPLWAAVLADHDRRVRAAIESAGGVVVKTEGDAVFAAFPGADPAIRAVADAFRAIAGTPFAGETPVRIRAGLHLGVGRLRADLDPGSPPDYVGIDVNYAARVAAAANGGQVLVSDALAAGLGSDVAALAAGTMLVDEGLRSLKDFEEPARLHRLVIPGAADDDRALRTLEAPTNLPHDSTTLVGRELDIARLADELRDGRILTLTGPGGSGKTRLAIGIAEAVRGGFPHGTWFVDLADVRDPDLFEPTIALTIRIRESAEQSLPEALRAYLRDRQILLLLDNVEQLLPPAAEATAGLIKGAPGLRVLATSRELLRIGGERGHVVAPLGLSDGVALFEDRARLHRPDLDFDDENRAIIRDICARLDGLPLAIELAAARIRVLAPAAILERLGRRLDLAGGARDLPERQRTLRGAIDWSHDLLAEPERALFRRLAAFAGGWTVETAAAVTDADGRLGIDVVEGLESLLDKSLIRTGGDADADASGASASTSGEARFSMHALLREYAAERLAETDEGQALGAAHAAVMRSIAERAGGEIMTAAGERALGKLDAEQHNLRAAIEWAIASGEVTTGLAILAATWRWFQQRGRLREGRAWLADLLGRPWAAGDVRLRIDALAADGGLAYWMEDFDTAAVRYEERLRLAESTADSKLLAEAHYDLGFLAMIASDAPRLLEHEGRALELFTELDDRPGIERARQALVLHEYLIGAYDEARRRTEENLEAFRRLGSMFQIADSLTLLSAVAWQQGDATVAWTRLLEGIRIFAERDLASGLARALGMTALLQLRFGDPAFGARLAGATAELRRQKSVMIAPTRVLHLPDAIELAVEVLGEERARELVEAGAATPVPRLVEEIYAAEAPVAMARPVAEARPG